MMTPMTATARCPWVSCHPTPYALSYRKAALSRRTSSQLVDVRKGIPLRDVTPSTGGVLGDGEIGNDAVVVACPNTSDRLVEQAVTSQDLQQGTVTAGSDEHVVDASRDSGRYFAGPHERVLRAEREAGFVGSDCLPRVLIADADSVQGAPAAPEGHARGVGRGVEVAQHDRRTFSGVLLQGQRGAPGLLLALHLKGERPVRFVVRYHQPPERHLELDDERRAPRQILPVLGGALVDLLEHPMRNMSRQHTADVVLARRGEGRHLVVGAEQLHDVAGADLLQRHYVRLEPAQGVSDDDATSVPIRVRRPEHVESRASHARTSVRHSGRMPRDAYVKQWLPC
jgi:hypothetical protein